jgi:hypothetical protein
MPAVHVTDLVGHASKFVGYGQRFPQAVRAAGRREGAGKHVSERRLVGHASGHLQRLMREPGTVTLFDSRIRARGRQTPH